MSEHVLSEKKIKELWNDSRGARFFTWPLMDDRYREAMMKFARSAYDMGKQSPDGDGFIPCEHKDIRKGDTVERTYTSPGGTITSVVSVAHYQDSDGDWRSHEGTMLTLAGVNYTYRRKPAKVTPPDPEKHPIIIDKYGVSWAVDDAFQIYYRILGGDTFPYEPEDFEDGWKPAEVTAKED